MAGTAERTSPQLWEAVKTEVKQGDKGGKAGQWSARKAQLAVSEYKKRGGGYEGRETGDNRLAKWTRQEWNTRSGRPSGETQERYLPKRAREALTDADYARTSAKKRRDSAKGKQVSRQPEDIAKKVGASRTPTRKALMQAAGDRNIQGRSRMNKQELEQALQA
jgi:hypothetical protein